MRTVVIVVGVIVLFLAVLWLLQRNLIYFPTQETGDVEAVLPGAEEVTYATDDGLRLAGWYLPGTGRGTVVVFNGNAGNRAHRSPLAAGLGTHGYAVLLVDYRGYGGNPGRPTEKGLARDAVAARAYLDGRAGVDRERVAYFGESLGASVATRLAIRRQPAALVLRSPFTSLADVGAIHYPFVPVSLLLQDRFDSAELVAAIDVPVMVIAGSEDSIVPTEQSRRVYEEATGEPKRLHIVEGAGHNDPELAWGPEMLEQVAAFLDLAMSDDPYG